MITLPSGEYSVLDDSTDFAVLCDVCWSLILRDDTLPCRTTFSRGSSKDTSVAGDDGIETDFSLGVTSPRLLECFDDGVGDRVAGDLCPGVSLLVSVAGVYSSDRTSLPA